MPLLVAAAGFVCAAHAQQVPLAKLESEYQSEANPVRRAKLLAKLGPLEVDLASSDFHDNKDKNAFAVLERLRDNLRNTTDALSASQQSPTRHPAGFKELQIGLRETLRRLDDLSSEVAVEDEERFAALRADLTAAHNFLIEALFPSSRDKRSNEGKLD